MVSSLGNVGNPKEENSSQTKKSRMRRDAFKDGQGSLEAQGQTAESIAEGTAQSLPVTWQRQMFPLSKGMRL